MNMSKVDCKVVMLGSADVGKTCMVERFLHGTWKDKTTTVRAFHPLTFSHAF
jgi:GTPase SAR1 family protein